MENIKCLKIEYGINSFLTICPDEDLNSFKNKFFQFTELVKNLDILKIISLVDKEHIEKLNQQSYQDDPPYNYGRKNKPSGGTLIEIGGCPLKIVVGSYPDGLQCKDIPQD